MWPSSVLFGFLTSLRPSFFPRNCRGHLSERLVGVLSEDTHTEYWVGSASPVLFQVF